MKYKRVLAPSIAGILFAISIFAPLPDYEIVQCVPCKINQFCPPCPRGGWVWKSSIYNSFIRSYQNRSSSTPSTWKLYTNKKYNYSFRYPPESNVQGEKIYGDDSNDINSIVGPENNHYFIVFTLETIKADTPLKQFIEQQYDIQNDTYAIIHSYEEDLKFKISKFEEISIGDQPAYHFIATDEHSGMIDKIYISLSNEKILVMDNGMGDRYSAERAYPDFDQILSTFKFIK